MFVEVDVYISVFSIILSTEAMETNKKHLVIFLVLVVGGTIVFAGVASGGYVNSSLEFSPQQPGFSGSSSDYLFGTNATGFTGWLMPANTLLATSFLANNSLNRFVGCTFNVFPFATGQDGVLSLGLYVNGELRAQRVYTLGNATGTSATIIQNLPSEAGNNLAVFSSSLVGYTVTLFMNNTLPVGTKITVTAFSSSPIWVQIANGLEIRSHEVSNSSPLPQTLQSTSDFSVAPYTPSIQVASSEG